MIIPKTVWIPSRRSRMTAEPSDAETYSHVSISEANKSSPVRGMTGFDVMPHLMGHRLFMM